MKLLSCDYPEYVFKEHGINRGDALKYLQRLGELEQQHSLRLCRETYGHFRYDFALESTVLDDGQYLKGKQGSFPITMFEAY